MTRITKIGVVKNRFNEPESPDVIKAEESVIQISKEYSDGLFRIEDSEYLDILFLMDRSAGFELQGPIFTGETKGIFASRNPNRPSPIGLSTVKLLKRTDNELTVSGLDALNDSPVIDIKPVNKIFSNEEFEVIRFNNLKANPGIEVQKYIQSGAVDRLLSMAAQIHRHYCPGLALGVLAGVYGMQKLKLESNGLEDLLAIVETNNCFSDGIQFVTGCTFGNNALIFKDAGKIAYSLVDRNGKGVRIIMKLEAREYMHSVYPEFSTSFEKIIANNERVDETITEFKFHGQKKAFAVIKLEFDRLFTVHSIEGVDLPEYAPSHESLICSVCNESIMASRSVTEDGKILCLECSGKAIHQLTGSGIKI